jgi:hypothetical protein
VVSIAKLKRFKSPGSDEIPAELIQAGGEILRPKIHELIIWNTVKLLISGKSHLLCQFTRRVANWM